MKLDRTPTTDSRNQETESVYLMEGVRHFGHLDFKIIKSPTIYLQLALSDCGPEKREECHLCEYAEEVS
jgi:hypothetical protein